MKRFFLLFISLFLFLFTSCDMLNDIFGDDQPKQDEPETPAPVYYPQIQVSVSTEEDGDYEVLYNGQTAYKFNDVFVEENNPDEYGVLYVKVQNIGDYYTYLHFIGKPYVKVEGATAAFSVLSQPEPVGIAYKSRDSKSYCIEQIFKIKFKPYSTSTVVADFVILTDSKEDEDFTFHVEGTGKTPRSVISVTDADDVNIANDSTYTINNVFRTKEYSIPFRIHNNGSRLLNLTDPKISISGSDADLFEIESLPADSVSARDFSTFKIKFTADCPAESEKKAYVTVTSDNKEIPSYKFGIRCNVIERKPEIAVEYDSATIRNGTDLVKDESEPIFVGDESVYDFIIKNPAGNDSLSIKNITVEDENGEISSAFAVTQMPESSVATGGNTSFKLKFTAASVGKTKGIVKIDSDSYETPVFSFTITEDVKEKSTDSSLKNINFYYEYYYLHPYFSPEVKEYTINIDESVTYVNLLPELNNDSCVSLKINGNEYIDSSTFKRGDFLRIPIAQYSKIVIDVLAQDAVTTTQYIINLNKIANYSSTDFISVNLKTSDESEMTTLLKEKVVNNKLEMYVKPSETQLKLFINAVSPKEEVYVNNKKVEYGEWSDYINLEQVNNAIPVKIIAEDGRSTRNFTVNANCYGKTWKEVGSLPATAWGDEALVVCINDKISLAATSKETGLWTYWTSPKGSWNWTNRGSFEDENVTNAYGSACVLNGTIYEIGGVSDGNASSCVSTSTNGIVWYASTANVNVFYHQALAFNNKIYLLGGYTATGDNLNDTNIVWSSSDGKTWTKEKTPAWSSRTETSACVYNGRMYIAGGCYNHGRSELKDVWSSADGSTWKCETSSAQWSGRNACSLVATSYGMYLIAGNDGEDLNDVWFSEDGKDWICVTKNSGFTPRNGMQSILLDGYLYILGGFNSAGECDLTDIWCTYVGE